MSLRSCLCAVLVLAAGIAEAQLTVKKNDIVTLKIPASFLDLEGTRIWDNSPIYVSRISPIRDPNYRAGGTAPEIDVMVNETRDWRLSGFPSLLTLRVEKIDQKDDYTEVELRSEAVNVKLRFAREFQDLEVAFRKVVAIGSQADGEAQEEAYAHIGEAVFQGPRQAVDTMVKWCWSGPPYARVSGVKAVEEPFDEAQSPEFSVRY